MYGIKLSCIGPHLLQLVSFWNEKKIHQTLIMANSTTPPPKVHPLIKKGYQLPALISWGNRDRLPRLLVDGDWKKYQKHLTSVRGDASKSIDMIAYNTFYICMYIYICIYMIIYKCWKTCMYIALNVHVTI